MTKKNEVFINAIRAAHAIINQSQLATEIKQLMVTDYDVAIITGLVSSN